MQTNCDTHSSHVAILHYAKRAKYYSRLESIWNLSLIKPQKPLNDCFIYQVTKYSTTKRI